MSDYAYYPGCSADGVGRAFTDSLHAVFEHLGTGLDELEDCAHAEVVGEAAVEQVDVGAQLAVVVRHHVLQARQRPRGRSRRGRTLIRKPSGLMVSVCFTFNS